MDPPSAMRALDMDCPICGKQPGNLSCPICKGFGQWKIERCPKAELRSGGGAGPVMDLLFAAEMAEKGLWPVAGGWMEQTDCVVQGVRMILGR